MAKTCRDCTQLRMESVQAYNDIRAKAEEAIERVNKLEAAVRNINTVNAQSTLPRRVTDLETKVRQIERDID